MPINGYSVGSDVTLVINTGAGPLPVDIRTGFTSKMDTTEQKIIRLDGITDHVRFINGWSGSFSLERAGGIIDRYFAAVEANYYAGIDELPLSIDQIIAELNGGISAYRYRKVMLKYDDAGDWGGDKSVKQKFSFLATTRVQIA
jgi:hypothetical protein